MPFAASPRMPAFTSHSTFYVAPIQAPTISADGIHLVNSITTALNEKNPEGALQDITDQLNLHPKATKDEAIAALPQETLNKWANYAETTQVFDSMDDVSPQPYFSSRAGHLLFDSLFHGDNALTMNSVAYNKFTQAFTNIVQGDDGKPIWGNYLGASDGSNTAKLMKDNLSGQVSEKNLLNINDRVTHVSKVEAQAAFNQLTQNEADTWAREAVTNNNNWFSKNFLGYNTLSSSDGKMLATTFAKLDPSSAAAIKIKNSFTNITGTAWGEHLGENKALDTANRIKDVLVAYGPGSIVTEAQARAYAADITNRLQVLSKTEKEAVIARLTPTQLDAWAKYSINGSPYRRTPLIASNDEGNNLINALFGKNNGIPINSPEFHRFMTAFSNITDLGTEVSERWQWSGNIIANYISYAMHLIEFPVARNSVHHEDLLAFKDTFQQLNREEKHKVIELMDPAVLNKWAIEAYYDNNLASWLTGHDTFSQTEGQGFVDSLLNDQNGIDPQSIAFTRIRQAFPNIKEQNGRFVWK